MRVLSVPGRHHENRFFQLTLEALERQGVSVIDPSMTNVARFNYDVLHINFPTHYITQNGAAKATVLSVLMAAYLLLARVLGRRIVYTVHDVVPFTERNSLLLWRFLHLVHRLTDRFVFLSESSREAFVARYPDVAATPWIVVPLGPYPVTPISSDERRRLRAQFGGDNTFILGLLGSIKPYKNVAALRLLPRHVADGRALRFLVAGRAEAGHAEAVLGVLATLPKEQLIHVNERIDDAQLDAMIQSVDLVLLPYLAGSNSSAATLVLSNEGRLIASDLPMFVELERSVGAPWVYSANVTSGVALANAVQTASSQEVTDADRTRLRDVLRRTGHDGVAVQLTGLYRSLAGP